MSIRAALCAAALLLAGSSGAALAAPQVHYPASIFNTSGQQIGSVNFVPQDQGGVEMVITTNGLPTGNYDMQITSAVSCPAQAAQTTADLGVISVDPRGNGAVTAYVPTLEANAIVGHAFVIGPNLSSVRRGSAPVACGVVGNS